MLTINSINHYAVSMLSSNLLHKYESLIKAENPRDKLDGYPITKIGNLIFGVVESFLFSIKNNHLCILGFVIDNDSNIYPRWWWYSQSSYSWRAGIRIDKHSGFIHKGISLDSPESESLIMDYENSYCDKIGYINETFVCSELHDLLDKTYSSTKDKGFHLIIPIEEIPLYEKQTNFNFLKMVLQDSYYQYLKKDNLPNYYQISSISGEIDTYSKLSLETQKILSQDSAITNTQGKMPYNYLIDSYKFIKPILNQIKTDNNYLKKNIIADGNLKITIFTFEIETHINNNSNFSLVYEIAHCNNNPSEIRVSPQKFTSDSIWVRNIYLKNTQEQDHINSFGNYKNMAENLVGLIQKRKDYYFQISDQLRSNKKYFSDKNELYYVDLSVWNEKSSPIVREFKNKFIINTKHTYSSISNQINFTDYISSEISIYICSIFNRAIHRYTQNSQKKASFFNFSTNKEKILIENFKAKLVNKDTPLNELNKIIKQFLYDLPAAKTLSIFHSNTNSHELILLICKELNENPSNYDQITSNYQYKIPKPILNQVLSSGCGYCWIEHKTISTTGFIKAFSK